MNGGESGQGGPTPPSAPPTPPNPGYGSFGVGGGNNAIVLTIFSVVCLVVYGYQTIQSVLRVFRNLFHWFTSFSGPFYLLGNLLLVVGGVWTCLMLVMITFKRNPTNSNGLILCLAGGGLVNIVGRVLLLLINLFITFGAPLLAFRNLVVTALGAVVATGGVYAIIRFVLGEPTITSFDTTAMANDVRAAFASLTQAAGDVGAQASQAARDAQSRQQQSAYNQQQAPQGGAYDRQAQQPYGQPGPAYQQPGQMPPPPPGYGVMHMKTDRSIIMYILLTLVTCGIYGWYFIYCLARDVNTVCAGDGKNTSGLGMYILLSFVTCGIYPIFWMYSLGNRLAENAPRYGMNFQENGSTVLLWYLVGMLLCGIGPLVAMNIVISNTNRLCTAYNIRNGV